MSILHKIADLFSRENAEKVEKTEVVEETPPKPIMPTIVFRLSPDGDILIDVNAELDFNPAEMAMLVAYISSMTGQLHLLDILKEGLDSTGRRKKYESFIGHFLALKRKEIGSDANDAEKTQDEPCINPLQML